LVEFYRDTDTSNVAQISNIFEGLEFVIINTNDKELSKPFLEKTIVSLGGKKVQNFRNTTSHVIADRRTFQVDSLIN
jgi:hypothetical protein